MVPDIETYNILIKNLMHQKAYNSTIDALESIINMVKLISKHGLTPNLRTFNSVLYSFSKVGLSKKIPSTTLQILQEMKLLNIGKKKSGLNKIKFY